MYKHQWSYIGQSKAMDGTKTYDGYYESYATGYLCDEHNYYITPAYADEGWYIEKTAFEDNRFPALAVPMVSTWREPVLPST